MPSMLSTTTAESSADVASASSGVASSSCITTPSAPSLEATITKPASPGPVTTSRAAEAAGRTSAVPASGCAHGRDVQRHAT